jgi:hypothetical protein
MLVGHREIYIPNIVIRFRNQVMAQCTILCHEAMTQGAQCTTLSLCVETAPPKAVQ